jgi:hypothetical protein
MRDLARLILATAALVPFSGFSQQLAAPEPARTERRVLLIGDSFVRQSFGRGLERELSDAGFSVLRRGKGSSGLARPDFFDWSTEGARLMAAFDPAVIVVMMGGNDGQDLLDRNRRGRVRWGEVEWAERYAARIQSFVEVLGAGSRRVLWVELPPMRGPRFEQKVEYIRGIQRATLARIPSARYLPTGRLLQTLCVGGAAAYAVHQPDGVHLTVEAGEALARLVALRLIPEIEPPELIRDERPRAALEARPVGAG